MVSALSWVFQRRLGPSFTASRAVREEEEEEETSLRAEPEKPKMHSVFLTSHESNGDPQGRVTRLDWKTMRVREVLGLVRPFEINVMDFNRTWVLNSPSR